MNLNLFENRKTEDNFINKFIEEFKKTLETTLCQNQNKKENSNVINEYNRYERRKIFLDNKSRTGNAFAWIMDEGSVCISKNGDGGPITISEILLPNNAKVGEVYENVDGKYIYNPDVTNKLKEII